MRFKKVQFLGVEMYLSSLNYHYITIYGISRSKAYSKSV